MKHESRIIPFERPIRGVIRHGIDVNPISGKRKRRIFKTKEERDEELKYLLGQRKQFGDVWATVDAREREEFGSLIQESKDLGFTLRQAVDFYKASKALPGPTQASGHAGSCI
jgi:hypothetical protein